jgi:hypothetical protein
MISKRYQPVSLVRPQEVPTITPSGKKRGCKEPIGPHVGTTSRGCPLFDKTKAGERDKEDFYRRFNANICTGGTTVILEELF